MSWGGGRRSTHISKLSSLAARQRHLSGLLKSERDAARDAARAALAAKPAPQPAPKTAHRAAALQQRLERIARNKQELERLGLRRAMPAEWRRTAPH